MRIWLTSFAGSDSVIGGVDTHGHSHHAAVIDGVGRQLDDREFPASPAGYGALLEWLRGYGELDRVGVEGTGTYGVALTRHLREAGAVVVEVDRPDRRARRAQGKSDPLDRSLTNRLAIVWILALNALLSEDEPPVGSSRRGDGRCVGSGTSPVGPR